MSDIRSSLWNLGRKAQDFRLKDSKNKKKFYKMRGGEQLAKNKDLAALAKAGEITVIDVSTVKKQTQGKNQTSTGFVKQTRDSIREEDKFSDVGSVDQAD